jgi:hypothetical protein
VTSGPLPSTAAAGSPRRIWFIAQENILYDYDTPMDVVTFLHQTLYGSTTAEAEKTALELLERIHFPKSAGPRGRRHRSHRVNIF